MSQAPTEDDPHATLLAALPAALRSHVELTTPTAARLRAAKGLLPLPPRDLVLVLVTLCHAVEDEVASAAAKSLSGMPDRLLGGALDGATLPPVAWGTLAKVCVASEPILTRVALQRDTPDAALAAIAAQAPASVVEILAENQQRCLRCEALVAGIRVNPNLGRASSDRLFDALTRAGVIYADMPEFAEAVTRLSPTQADEIVASIPLPGSVAALLTPEPEAAPEADAEPEPQAELSTGAALETTLEGVAAAVMAAPDPAPAAPSDEAPRPAKLPMQQVVQGLNTAQKVALALKGNREARSILIRESNRVIATAVIKNPRITAQEVCAAAQNRNSHDAVIRIISASRELSRPYAVKLALAFNPKTPLVVSMRLLGVLRQGDVMAIAKSKAVPQNLAKEAQKKTHERG